MDKKWSEDIRPDVHRAGCEIFTETDVSSINTRKVEILDDTWRSPFVMLNPEAI